MSASVDSGIGDAHCGACALSVVNRSFIRAGMPEICPPYDMRAHTPYLGYVLSWVNICLYSHCYPTIKSARWYEVMNDPHRSLGSDSPQINTRDCKKVSLDQSSHLSRGKWSVPHGDKLINTEQTADTSTKTLELSKHPDKTPHCNLCFDKCDVTKHIPHVRRARLSFPDAAARFWHKTRW